MTRHQLEGNIDTAPARRMTSEPIDQLLRGDPAYF